MCSVCTTANRSAFNRAAQDNTAVTFTTTKASEQGAIVSTVTGLISYTECPPNGIPYVRVKGEDGFFGNHHLASTSNLLTPLL